MPATPRDCSAAPAERHPARRDRERADVRLEGQIGHQQHGAGRGLDVEGGLDPAAAVGLQRTGSDPELVHDLGAGVADVDLPAGDAVRPAVQIDGPGESGQRVLADSVGAAPLSAARDTHKGNLGGTA